MRGLPERPCVGDELVMVTAHRRYENRRPVTEYTESLMRVTAAARFKITLVPVDGPEGNAWGRDFDWRTGEAWGDRSEFSYQGPRVYTPEGWKRKQLESRARRYLSGAGVSASQLRGSLAAAARGREVELANLLRAFEGLEELK